MQWISLENSAQLSQLQSISEEMPCLIFKHSTQCSISALAKKRLEDRWDFAEEEVRPYYLDLLAHRELSNQIAEVFATPHASPQVLLIRSKHCTYDADGLDISVKELRECFHDNW